MERTLRKTERGILSTSKNAYKDQWSAPIQGQAVSPLPKRRSTENRKSILERQGSNISSLGMDDPVDTAKLRLIVKETLSILESKTGLVRWDHGIYYNSTIKREVNQNASSQQQEKVAQKCNEESHSVRSDRTAVTGDGFDKELFESSLSDMNQHIVSPSSTRRSADIPPGDPLFGQPRKQEKFKSHRRRMGEEAGQLTTEAQTSSDSRLDIATMLDRLPLVSPTSSPGEIGGRLHSSCNTVYQSPIAVPIPEQKPRVLPKLSQALTKSPTITSKKIRRRSVDVGSTEFQLDLFS